MKTYNLQKLYFFFIFIMISTTMLFAWRAYAADTTPPPADKAVASQPAKPSGVAQVVWVKGVVKAISINKTERTLQRRDVVYEKDVIVTDKEGSGQLVFTDNTLIALRESTEVHIDKYKFTGGKAPSEDQYLVSLAKGGFRTITGQIAKTNPANYQVNTPVATIGVRGTQWSVYIGPESQLYFKIESGSIKITTPQGVANLSEGTKNLYAVIVKGQVPVVTSQVPAGASATFSAQPNIVPAKSSMPTSDTNAPAAGAAGTTGGTGGTGGTSGGASGSSGGGSSSGGTGSSSSGTSSGTSTGGSSSGGGTGTKTINVNSFCIGG